MGVDTIVIVSEVLVGVVVLAFVGGLFYRMHQATQRTPTPMYLPVQAPMFVPLPVPLVPAVPQIKKVSCRECGAQKVQAPRTACLYCDYCGALVDWDFRVAASTTGSSQPGPELRRLMAQEKHVQAQARAVGDREAYRASLLRVYEQHMHGCPAAYPPRIADPAYRQRLLVFLSTVELEQGFDPSSLAHEAAVEQAVAQLSVVHGYGGVRQVEPQAFMRLLSAKKAFTERAMALMGPHLHLHPDNPTAELAVAIINSTFAQYWLPFLAPQHGDWLLRELGLSGEYVPLTPVHTTERHCGGCGQTLAVVPGARRVMCELCGRPSDVSRPEIACGNCHGPVSVLAGAGLFACPYCQADMRVDGLG